MIVIEPSIDLAAAAVPLVDIIDPPSSSQTLPETNPPTFLANNIYQPPLSQLPRDAPGKFGSSVFGLVSRLLGLDFTNLLLGLLQLNLIQT